MADDSAEFDAMEATEMLSVADVDDAIADFPTEMLKTDVIIPSEVFEDEDEDAVTVSLVRQCPDCGLMFSAEFDNCPVDNANLVPLAKGLGGSLPGGYEPAPTTEPDAARAYALDETEVQRLREVELGVADDETIRGSVLDGRFYVEELIGEGGMGRVYRGSQLSVGRVVAIKVLHRRISGDPSIRERFNREARLVSQFSHPNTVRLIEFGEADGHLYMAMEFVEGVSLQAFAGRAPLNVAFALEILRQVCGPLAEAHKAEVVHRDLKPENLFVTRTADSRLQVKLLDFGVAHIDPTTAPDQADTYRELTKQGVVIGTPEYMAPEQARGEFVSTTTDIFSLGVLLYQMLSGKLPFWGQTPMHTMFQLVTKPVPPITDHLPDCPLPLVELVESLLQKEPARRLPNVVQLARRIREVELALKLPPIGELPSGDLRAVLAGMVFTDTAAGSTEKDPQPELRIPSTERTPTPVFAFEDDPIHVPPDRAKTAPSGEPEFVTAPMNATPHAKPRPNERQEPISMEFEMVPVEDHPSEPTAEPHDWQQAPQLIQQPVKISEPTAEIAKHHREEPYTLGDGFRARRNVEPTELMRPYVPPDAPTMDVRERSAGFYVKLLLLTFFLIAVVVAVGWGLTKVIQQPQPEEPPAPAVVAPPRENPALIAPEPPAQQPDPNPEPVDVKPAVEAKPETPPTPEPKAAAQPAVKPKPAPQPKPEPKPKPEARPAPKPEPKPTPVAKPTPEPEPASDPVEPDPPVIAVPEPDPPKTEDKGEAEDEPKDAPVEEPAETTAGDGAPPTLIIEGADDEAAE